MGGSESRESLSLRQKPQNSMAVFPVCTVLPSIAHDLYVKRHPIQEICRTLKISKATLYRSIKTGERPL
jgi:hypothetical protein